MEIEEQQRKIAEKIRKAEENVQKLKEKEADLKKRAKLKRDKQETQWNKGFMQLLGPGLERLYGKDYIYQFQPEDIAAVLLPCLEASATDTEEQSTPAGSGAADERQDAEHADGGDDLWTLKQT